MNTITKTISTVFLVLFLSSAAIAQEQVAVPLSHPGQPGKLSLGIVRGSIKVSGYDGKEILIRYSSEDSGDESHKVTKNGLRRISSNSVGFEAEEDNNKVEISGSSPMKTINFDISVPHNFSLELSTVNDGNIRVNDVSGEMDISNVNGKITLNNVGGAAVVNTVNGDITASFASIDQDKPMAFSNLNGDINVTLPANAKISAKMKSEWGEVFTDFDMDISHTGNKNMGSTDKEGVYKVSVNNWIYGKINGGGPEYQFKSMRGDIYIRKQ